MMLIAKLLVSTMGNFRMAVADGGNMIQRIKIADDDPIQSAASRLAQLGCLPHQITKHINALQRPKPEPRFQHLSEVSGKWERQLAERPLLMDDGANRRVERV